MLTKEPNAAPEPEVDIRRALALELARLDSLLAKHLLELRRRGRSIIGDAVGGAVIEEGEAEGLLRELSASHAAVGAAPSVSDNWKTPLAPLARAVELYGLLPVERDLLLLGLSVEIDSRYARLIAFLNDHVRMGRPTLGLGAALFSETGNQADETLLARFVNDGPLRRYALIELGPDEPLANRSFAVSAGFWPWLIGIDTVSTYAMSSLSEASLDELELPPAVRRQAEITREWACRQPKSELLVVVSGRAESGRDALAKCIAAGLTPRALNLRPTEFESPNALAVLEREARWHNASIILLDPDRINPEVRTKLLARASVPLFYVVDSKSSAELMHATARRTIEVAIPERELEAETSLWRRLLAGAGRQDSIDARALAARFSFGPARIQSALRVAQSSVEASCDPMMSQTDIESACHRLREIRFGEHAERLPCPFEEGDLVLPPKTRQELELIVAWARHGARVFGREGRGRKLNTGRGLACVFSGPPGTGKTMATQVIARRIDFDVYRVDLSRVVNKYIGETEKNLAKVFDEAERSKVILFFDEADALFGRRSEVKDAHDRYANIEVSYLLQRLESHAGLVILATNMQKNFDEAFLRRLQVVAKFPMPTAADRRAIWERMLAHESVADSDIDLNLLSGRFEIAGGDIRNAIFTALLLAAEEGASLHMRHLVLGLWRELQKSGRVVDLVHFGEWRTQIESSLERAIDRR